MERFKERAFGFLAVGMGGGTATLFAVIALRKTAYIAEPNSFILFTELTLSLVFFLLAIERLVKGMIK